jgi:hypothetical protein
MPKRSRIAKDLLTKLESVGLQIYPHAFHETHIKGRIGPTQLDLLQEILPDLKAHWSEIMPALTNRDENESAAAVMRIIGAEDNPAAILGRRGGLKGGHARAAAMTKKERSESAKKAALAWWSSKRPTRGATRTASPVREFP